MRKRNKLLKLEQQKRAQGSHEIPGEHDEGIVKPARRGGRIKGEGKKIYPKDMYKVLDGSALVVIGLPKNYDGRSYLTDILLDGRYVTPRVCQSITRGSDTGWMGRNGSVRACKYGRRHF